MVAVTACEELLVAVKEGMFPLPDPPSPIDVKSLVQSMLVAPADTKFTAAVGALLQTVWFEIGLSTGVGLTVMLNVSTGPEQATPLCVNVGVTVMFAVMGVEEVFVPINEAMSPFPEAANPIAVLEFVQAYVVVPRVLFVVNGFGLMEDPLQTSIAEIAFTCAVGFTVTTKEVLAPKQEVPLSSNKGVTVTVELIGDVPVLVAVNPAKADTLLALLAIPVAVLLFVQLYPVATPLKLKAAFKIPLHTVKLSIGSTTGVGNTTILAEEGSPTHAPLCVVAIPSIVIVCGVEVVFSIV